MALVAVGSRKQPASLDRCQQGLLLLLGHILESQARDSSLFGVHRASSFKGPGHQLKRRGLHLVFA